MSSIANKIDSNVRPVKEILAKKYIVDHFQREYVWEKKHIEQLLIDLEAAFSTNYNEGHKQVDVAKYNCYYLGPIVLSDIDNIFSIVDGQQRLTSITLLLIYLNNLQKDNDDKEEIEPFIYSKQHGKRSYNIEVPDRTKILDALFLGKEIDIEKETDESIRNMYERYQDINELFPEDLKKAVLPLFIDWVKEKIVFVEIMAYTNENAYTIFETMNDRGMNLTPTQMLKGFLLNNIKDPDRVVELNILWKQQISRLHTISIQEDLEFFKAWFRSCYAETIRSTIKGAENEDFEKIGTRFHTWVRDNAKTKLGLKDKDSDAFYFFIKGDFDFYSNIYLSIISAINNYNPRLETLYLSSFWSIAYSLSFPLLMAPINKLDDEDTIIKKLDAVSKFIDILTIVRAINGKAITQTALRYYIYTLVKEIRNKDLNKLKFILQEKIKDLSDKIENINSYLISYQNRKFNHYLLARITYYVEKEYLENKYISFYDLMAPRRKNRFYFTHLINFDSNFNKKNFKDDNEQLLTIDLLGNFVLLPYQLAEEFEGYDDITKLELLKKQNYIAESCYETKNIDELEHFNLTKIKKFNHDNILNRTIALNKIIMELWSYNKI